MSLNARSSQSKEIWYICGYIYIYNIYLYQWSPTDLSALLPSGPPDDESDDALCAELADDLLVDFFSGEPLLQTGLVLCTNPFSIFQCRGTSSRPTLGGQPPH